MKTQKIWLITGASQGLGLATVKYLLSQGQIVVATTRNASAFHSEVTQNTNLEVLSLDITDESSVSKTIEYISKKYGRIDVLINNAGFGFAGAIEEASEAEISKVLSVNVEAMLRVTRYVLPVMRRAKNGHIINLSSIAGLASTAGFGIYNASKYAVEGFSEALSLETKALGIKVTLVEPGAFRTNFLDSSLAVADRTVAEYDATAGQFRRNLQANNGRQAGNPQKAAQVIASIVDMEQPPLRLLLGSDAYKRAVSKFGEVSAEIERFKNITLSTDFQS
ncbi:oxidoreductase [Flavobacterium sp.]|uniref:oxidoreductase n=1 Tax=Flavobacterium sp. TaxID=239 RepID=UPI0011F47552|nr:oxidoreductase [Flavobacterium sp.]RZJ72555.1 MAG: SDR family NAD(P)-dependent oxidoreductase [Flavobacterium sp.]